MHTSLRSLVLLLLAGASLSAQGGGGGGVVVSGGGGGGETNIFRGGVTNVVNGMNPPPPPIPTGIGAISGTILNGVTRRPVPNTVVMLRLDIRDAQGRMNQRPVGTQLTDTLGRFVFTDLPAGNSFMLSVQRAGFFGGAYGASAGSTTGTPIVLADGEWFSRADVNLWPSSVISGRVTDSYGDPMVGAYVRVIREILVGGTRRLAAAAPVTTDDRGIYRIAGLDPGQYLVCVPSVQASLPAAMAFPREPVVDLDRSTRLIVGRYPAAPSADASMVYPPTCYPGVTSITAAAIIDVRFGADRADVDLRVQAVRGYRVSGRVNGSPGGSTHTLRLVPVGGEDLGYGIEASTTIVRSDGTFTFVGVPPGDYALDARTSATEYTYSPEVASPAGRFVLLPSPPSPGGSMNASDLSSSSPRTGMQSRSVGSGALWGRVAVSVAAQDVPGVVVPLNPSASIAGRIVFEGTAAKPTQPAIVEADPADAAPVRSSGPGPDRTADAFLVRDLPPGQYFLRVRGLGDSWALKSIRAGGRDYTREPFDLRDGANVGDVVLTMTDQGVEMTGTVRDGQGRPLTNAAVVIFPSDRATWRNFGVRPDRILSIRPTSTGTYRVANLMSGDYFIVAVDDGLMNAWHDPKFLEAAAAAARRISLTWGQPQSVDLVRVDLP